MSFVSAQVWHLDNMFTTVHWDINVLNLWKCFIFHSQGRAFVFWLVRNQPIVSIILIRMGCEGAEHDTLPAPPTGPSLRLAEACLLVSKSTPFLWKLFNSPSFSLPWAFCLYSSCSAKPKCRGSLTQIWFAAGKWKKINLFKLSLPTLWFAE